MTGLVEAELELFTQGDVQAFEALFREYQGDVYGWIIRIVHDSGAAEDPTIETFWRIYRARARFDPCRSFGAWARRIASNLALEHLSRRRLDRSLYNGFPIRAPGTGTPDVCAKALAAFDELPAKLRVTARLAMIEEMPYAEIADALGISTNGVKSRVFRAIRLLRKSLEKRGVRP